MYEGEGVLDEDEGGVDAGGGAEDAIQMRNVGVGGGGEEAMQSRLADFGYRRRGRSGVAHILGGRLAPPFPFCEVSSCRW